MVCFPYVLHEITFPARYLFIYLHTMVIFIEYIFRKVSKLLPPPPRLGGVHSQVSVHSITALQLNCVFPPPDSRSLLKAGPPRRPTEVVASGASLVRGTHRFHWSAHLLLWSLLPHLLGLERKRGWSRRRNAEGRGDTLAHCSLLLRICPTPSSFPNPGSENSRDSPRAAPTSSIVCCRLRGPKEGTEFRMFPLQAAFVGGLLFCILDSFPDAQEQK